MIFIIKADVFTILYILYKFTMKPDSMDFDTFYKSRFCGRLREKIDKVMEQKIICFVYIFTPTD